jgi:hypothetical protein
MNAYMADQIAREHADRLMADAAAARRARRAKKGRRSVAARNHSRNAHRPETTAAAHLVTRPFAAVRSWLVAGQL